MAAVLASARCVVLKELNFMATFGTIGLKYGSWLPVTGVLSRTFHGDDVSLLSVVRCQWSSVYMFLKSELSNSLNFSYAMYHS